MAWRSNGIWKFKCYARTTIFSTEEELHISNLAISVFQHPLRACGRVWEYWINGQPRKSRPRRVGMLCMTSKPGQPRKDQQSKIRPRRATEGDINQNRGSHERASRARSSKEKPLIWRQQPNQSQLQKSQPSAIRSRRTMAGNSNQSEGQPRNGRRKGHHQRSPWATVH